LKVGSYRHELGNGEARWGLKMQAGGYRNILGVAEAKYELEK